MPREKPCMLCGNTLSNDVCTTPGCAYNPDAEGQFHDAEWERDENMHQEPEIDEDKEIPVGHGDVALEDLPDGDLLEGDFEDEQRPTIPRPSRRTRARIRTRSMSPRRICPSRRSSPRRSARAPRRSICPSSSPTT